MGEKQLLTYLFTCTTAAHQPARGENSVCGENLPIQVSEVFGGRVWTLTTFIAQFFPQSLLFRPASSSIFKTQNVLILYVSFCLTSFPAEANPSTLSRGTQGGLLPVGGLHVFKEPQLPGGTLLVQCICQQVSLSACMASLPIKETQRLSYMSVSVFRSCCPCVEVTWALHCLGWNCTPSTSATTPLSALTSH